MSFLQDLKKRFKGSKRSVEILPAWFYVKAMSEQDIELLAKICYLCEPCIRKKYNDYVYYIPNEEKNFSTAKEIFSRNGMTACQHYSHIISSTGTDVLRIDYKWCANPNVLYDNAAKIKRKSIERFNNFFVRVK